MTEFVAAVASARAAVGPGSAPSPARRPHSGPARASSRDGGLAEEPGWREFAMPRLQRRHHPVVGTLILGPLWGAWHLPLFVTEWGAWMGGSWRGPVEFVATAMAISFVMTWVFNRTGESLPVAMLLHTSVNNFISLAWSSMFPSLSQGMAAHAILVAFTAAALVVVVTTRGRLGCPSSAPAGYQLGSRA
jgi:hypothetical protein